MVLFLFLVHQYSELISETLFCFFISNLKPFSNANKFEGLEASCHSVVPFACVAHPLPVFMLITDEIEAVGRFCIKVLHSEFRGFLIGADYTSVARKMMTRKEEGC